MYSTKNNVHITPQMTKGEMQLKNTGGNSSNYNKFEAQPHYSDEYYPKTILDFPLRRFKGGHPTQKPVELGGVPNQDVHKRRRNGVR